MHDNVNQLFYMDKTWILERAVFLPVTGICNEAQYNINLGLR
jgi:hypothetical protein